MAPCDEITRERARWDDVYCFMHSAGFRQQYLSKAERAQGEKGFQERYESYVHELY